MIKDITEPVDYFTNTTIANELAKNKLFVVNYKNNKWSPNYYRLEDAMMSHHDGGINFSMDMDMVNNNLDTEPDASMLSSTKVALTRNYTHVYNNWLEDQDNLNDRWFVIKLVSKDNVGGGEKPIKRMQTKIIILEGCWTTKPFSGDVTNANPPLDRAVPAIPEGEEGEQEGVATPTSVPVPVPPHTPTLAESIVLNNPEKFSTE